MSKARSRAFGILFSAAVVAGIGCSHGAGREPAPRPPASGVATPSPLGKGFEPARTFAVIAGVLSFRDPALTHFSPRHRKDHVNALRGGVTRPVRVREAGTERSRVLSCLAGVRLRP